VDAKEVCLWGLWQNMLLWRERSNAIIHYHRTCCSATCCSEWPKCSPTERGRAHHGEVRAGLFKVGWMQGWLASCPRVACGRLLVMRGSAWTALSLALGSSCHPA
jgi:hypothetical protein